MASVMIAGYGRDALRYTEHLAIARPQHRRAMDDYLVTERAIHIAAALGDAPETLIRRRDETRHLPTGYAQLVARASQAGA